MADEVLITASQLASELGGETPPAVLDVRWSLLGPPGVAAYNEAHVPSAVFVDLSTALAAPPGEGGRHPLPSADDFTAAMRAAGVDASRLVVVYDAADSSAAAARAWWLLRYFGHAAVRILDGGLAAWSAGGYRVDAEVVDPLAGDFTAEPGHMPVIDAAKALSIPERGGALLDVRAPERFRGEKEPVDPVAGHIPGARNLPVGRVVDEQGKFLDPETMLKRFAQAGANPHLVVAAYCGSGVTAAHAVAAGAVAGIDVTLYPGSWSDWITDPARPVAVGEA